MSHLSRRKLAEYTAEQLTSRGVSSGAIIKKVAAYLVDTGRTKEITLLVRDIEYALSQRGVVVADVVSARQLSSSMKTEIEKLLGAKDVHYRETVDSDVLGGLKIAVPGKQFDGTLRRKITLLKAKQL